MADFAEENESLEESTEKKKKGLPIIPIVIIVVLIVAIGAVGWFVVMPMLSGGGSEEQTAETDTPVEGVEQAASTVYDPENKPGILEFRDPFTIKLRKRQGVLETETYLQFAVSLEVVSPEVQTEMEGDAVVMARIQDKINTFFASKYPSNVEVHNWPLLKEQLINELNDEFPEDYQILRINFHDFLLQPGR